jgi:hypothetical protein
MAGAQVMIDLANSPSFEDKAVLEFFETSGRNLLAAEAAAGVRPCAGAPAKTMAQHQCRTRQGISAASWIIVLRADSYNSLPHLRWCCGSQQVGRIRSDKHRSPGTMHCRLANSLR